MLYITPTKKGIGVEIWGTYEDLDCLYDVIGKFWNHEQYHNAKGFENRDKLISGFSYEIRKAKEGIRDQRESSHFSPERTTHYGTKLSRVHLLFSLSAIKYNMQFYATTKLDVSMLLQLEFWVERAMKEFDEIGAKNLVGYIENGLDGANELIYQYMRGIHIDYVQLGGGKRAFRKLPELLKRGVFFTGEYKEYRDFLEKEAKRLQCSISDLELDDDHIDYEHLQW